MRFEVHCGEPATRVGEYRWYGTVNGVGVGGTVNLPAGFGGRVLGEWPVSTTQYVTLGQQATGTQGLGGAASFSAYIFRATVPAAPSPVGVDQLTPTSARYRFSGNSNGGAAITGWQAQIATNSGFTTGVQTVSSNGTTTFNNLTPATRYYFRARGSNSVGWGPWSSSVNAMTESGAYVSVNGKWVPVPINWSNGSTWKPLAPLVSNGTTWVKPT